MSTKYSTAQINGMDDGTLFKLAKELNIKGAATLGTKDLRQYVMANLTEHGLIDESLKGSSAASAPLPPEKLAVTVVYAPYNDVYPNLVGKTVAAAKEALAQAMSIAPDARVYLNGKQLDAAAMATTMQAGDRLEFQKPAAEKG